jgi:hypothetical protein
MTCARTDRRRYRAAGAAVWLSAVLKRGRSASRRTISTGNDALWMRCRATLPTNSRQQPMPAVADDKQGDIALPGELQNHPVRPAGGASSVTRSASMSSSRSCSTT